MAKTFIGILWESEVKANIQPVIGNNGKTYKAGSDPIIKLDPNPNIKKPELRSIRIHTKVVGSESATLHEGRI